MLHLTNPCAKQKVLSLTKPKGKIYKTKSLGNYITVLQIIIDLGVMAMKAYSAYSRAFKLEPRRWVNFCDILKTRPLTMGDVLLICI